MVPRASIYRTPAEINRDGRLTGRMIDDMIVLPTGAVAVTTAQLPRHKIRHQAMQVLPWRVATISRDSASLLRYAGSAHPLFYEPDNDAGLARMRSACDIPIARFFQTSDFAPPSRTDRYLSRS